MISTSLARKKAVEPSGGGAYENQKTKRKKRQPFFFLLFVLGNVGLKPVLASHVF
eukprot:COSAG06_NODE_20351_length_798_cov_187.037196_1_plen_54_part_10